MQRKVCLTMPSVKRERASDCVNTDKSQKAFYNFSVYFETNIITSKIRKFECLNLKIFQLHSVRLVSR